MIITDWWLLQNFSTIMLLSRLEIDYDICIETIITIRVRQNIGQVHIALFDTRETVAT